MRKSYQPLTMKGQSHPLPLLGRIRQWMKEKCFTQRVYFLPQMQMARKPPSRTCAPAHVPSGLACARYVDRRLPRHRTQTSLSQMMRKVSSPLMGITMMILRTTASICSSVHLVSSSLKQKSLFGIMSVPPAQPCCDPIARYATLSSMTDRYFRCIWRVFSRSRVSSV